MSNALFPSDWGTLLVSPYPRAAFLQIPTGVSPSENDIRRFVRLWLTEGIPFCFQDYPIVYEALREYVAGPLRMNAKDVSMVGSGRIGFSLSPKKALREYAPGHSDIDLLVISDTLFKVLCTEFTFGMDRWRNKSVLASKREARFLAENMKRVPLNISKGFIDSNKIPVFRDMYPRRDPHNYVPRQKLKCDTMLRNLTRLINEFEEPCRFRVGKPLKSLRVYSSWDSAIKQNCITLRDFVRRISSGEIVAA